MGGKRLGNFREGDRSEYWATTGLSRFAFVTPIPRQEDFGVVDFLCVLTRREDKFVFPESAFYVQVKSAKKDIILDADAIRWITHHMDHPLFLCIADKAKSELTFYSLSRIWLALFLRTEPKTIALKLDVDNPPEPWVLREEKGEAHFEVLLGPPILQQDLSSLEEDASLAFSVFDAWIRIDVDNIARRRLGRLAVRCFWEWQTNSVPAQRYLDRYYFGPNYAATERALVPILTALGHNYIHYRQQSKLEALRGILWALEPLLGEHGRKIADGTFTITN